MAKRVLSPEPACTYNDIVFQTSVYVNIHTDRRGGMSVKTPYFAFWHIVSPAAGQVRCTVDHVTNTENMVFFRREFQLNICVKELQPFCQ